MLTHFSITQQGAHHKEKDSPCQDFSESRSIRLDRLNCDLVLAAIADGVGSCIFSQCGAETAVTGFLSCLTHNLNKEAFRLSDESVMDLIEHAFRYALYQVSAKAKEMELPFTEFDSTLTGVIFDGRNLWFGHVGDDGIVVMYADGTYEMITERHEGDEIGALYPLCCEEKWQFGKASKEVSSLVLMTDGVLNYCVDGRAMNNRVFFPFLEPALTTVIKTDEQVEEQKQRWEDILLGSYGDSGNYNKRVITDDITFVVVTNPEAVDALPKIEFDQESWDADTKRRREEVDKELYAEYWKYKEKWQLQLWGDLKGQENTEGAGRDEPAADDDQVSLPEGAPLVQPQQDKKEKSNLQRQDSEKRTCEEFPKSRDSICSMPPQGMIIHVPSDAQVSKLFRGAFEPIYSAAKGIRKSMSQILRKPMKSFEQGPQPGASKLATEPEEQENE